MVVAKPIIAIITDVIMAMVAIIIVSDISVNRQHIRSLRGIRLILVPSVLMGAWARVQDAVVIVVVLCQELAGDENRDANVCDPAQQQDMDAAKGGCGKHHQAR